MLVLKRRENEFLRFPQVDLDIHFQLIRGSTVKVGVDAPRKLRVLRGELSSTSFEAPNDEVDPLFEQCHRQIELGNTVEALRLLAQIRAATRPVDEEQYSSIPGA